MQWTLQVQNLIALFFKVNVLLLSPVITLRVAVFEDLHVLSRQLTEVLQLSGLGPCAGAVGLLVDG